MSACVSQHTDSRDSLSPPVRKTVPSLEEPALLSRPGERWLLKRYVTAGEAVIAWVWPSGERQPGLAEPVDEEPNPDREPEYGRRARGRARRWIRANRCAYMWTLTFRDRQLDYDAVAQAVDRLLRRLAEADWGPRSGRMTRHLTSNPKMLLIAEPHPGGHGWHVHGATDTYLAHAKMEKMWGEGYVFVTRPKTGRRAWSPRVLAAYLSKYLTKQLEPDELHGCRPRPAGAHRYWVTQGHDPEVIRTWHPTRGAAVAYLYLEYGRPDVEYELEARDQQGPAGLWFAFPDLVVERWLKRVNAEVRAQRGVR